MGWFEIADSMMDDGMDVESRRRGESRQSMAFIDMLAGPQPNHDGYNDRDYGRGRTLFTISMKWIAGAFVLWLLAYISAAFPYLGTYGYERDGIVQNMGGFGARHMVLFKGQTAFIDYEVDSKPGFAGNVFIDIAPWPGINFSPNMRRVSGKQKGTLSVVVPKTGVYTFYHSIGPMAYRQDMEYSVTWGAR